MSVRSWLQPPGRSLVCAREVGGGPAASSAGGGPKSAPGSRATSLRVRVLLRRTKGCGTASSLAQQADHADGQRASVVVGALLRLSCISNFRKFSDLGGSSGVGSRPPAARSISAARWADRRTGVGQGTNHGKILSCLRCSECSRQRALSSSRGGRGSTNSLPSRCA